MKQIYCLRRACDNKYLITTISECVNSRVLESLQENDVKIKSYSTGMGPITLQSNTEITITWQNFQFNLQFNFSFFSKSIKLNYFPKLIILITKHFK